MRKLGLLLKVQLLGMFGLNRVIHAGGARDRARLLGLFVLFVLAGAMVATYAYGSAAGLVMMGAAAAVPGVAVAAGSLAGVLVAFLKASGTLFGSKDFDLTVSLPVPLWVVAASRVAAVYGMNLLWSALLMLPMFAAALPALGVGAGGWVAAVASVALAPLAPLAAAVAASFALTALASRLRWGRVAAGVIGLVASVGLVAAIMAASGTLGAGAGASAPAGALAADVVALGQLGASVAGAVESLWPPAAWAAAGIASGNMLAFLLFAAVSLGAGAALVALLGRYLVSINSLLASAGPRRRAVADGAFRRRPAWRALVAKELRAVVGTPPWLTNTAVGPLLALALGVACLVAGPNAASLVATGVHGVPVSAAELGSLIEGMMGAIVPWVLVFCLVIAPTSSSALSLEGDARWIMQTVPQTSAALMGAKMLASAALAVPAAVAAGAMASIGLRVGPFEAAAFVAVPLAAALWASALGAFLNGRMPRYDWTSEYEVVKRSAPVVIALFAGVALTVAGVAASVAIPALAGVPTAAVQLACAVLVVAASALLARAATASDLRG